MGEVVEQLPVAEVEAAAGVTPALPIEAPLVRVVRALEALSGQTALILFLLENAPRDDAGLTTAMNTAVAKVNEASASLWHLQQIRTCGGQS